MIVCLCMCVHTHMARQTVERETNAGAKPAALGAPITLRQPYCHRQTPSLLTSPPPVGPHEGKGPSAGTDRDDGWTVVLQVQEQGYHALVHLGSQATWLPACHRC